jgi:3',5'-cyclic AMP phosphodiesterase CpdA
MKFLQISDVHLVPDGGQLYGLEPEARLRACIADVNQHHCDADFVVFTGDLAHTGHRAAYARLIATLAELKLPYHLMIGNHDHRENFKSAFPSAPHDTNGFIQFAFDTPAGRFICLDSNEPGVPYGSFCEARAAWLGEELDRAASQPTYLFVHHHPFPVGLKRMDVNRLRDDERLAAKVRGRKNIKHIFMGHLHRPISGTWLDIPFSVLPGTSHQVALDFVIEGVVPGSHEPPAYAVIFLEGDTSIVHLRNFLDTTATFRL